MIIPSSQCVMCIESEIIHIESVVQIWGLIITLLNKIVGIWVRLAVII